MEPKETNEFNFSAFCLLRNNLHERMTEDESENWCFMANML